MNAIRICVEEDQLIYILEYIFFMSLLKISAKIIYVEENQQTSDDGDKDPKIVNINSLDYDSLAKIIMLLPIPERIEMEKVCTKWKEACQLAWYDIKEYKCQSSIGRCYDNRLLTQSYLEKILSRCGNYLMELSLSDVCDLSIMPFVGDHCKNLTSLECKLKVNSLNYFADDYVQAFTQLDKLKCIKITVDLNISNNTSPLSAIIDSLPEELNEIHLFAKPFWYRKRKVSMTFKKFKNLKKLTLNNFWLKNIIQEIAEITTLVHLNTGLYNDHNRNLFLFNKLVNLEYIDLTAADIDDSLTDLSTKVLETIFCTCKNLKHLDIPSGPYDVTKIPLKKWINFQNLEYLGISCNIIPDLANTIVEYCKNLKHLRIYYCNFYPVNNTALKKLTELENLEYLMLRVDRLHKESIIAISNNFRKLKRLEIIGCATVPSFNGNSFDVSSVLDELSKLQCLEHLNLCWSKDLEDSTITAIANNCKNLKSLDIQGCSAITKTALDALTNLKNLQKLDVSFLNIITDGFIIKLGGIKELHCSGCKKLTNAGIIRFIKNNPDLEKIDIESIDNITTDMIIGADQATENRTNGIILHINLDNRLMKEVNNSLKPIITSQWLAVVDKFY